MSDVKNIFILFIPCAVDEQFATHDAHHSQTHSQQRTLTQHDMLPQYPVNIMELFCEYFKNDFSKE